MLYNRLFLLLSRLARFTHSLLIIICDNPFPNTSAVNNNITYTLAPWPLQIHTSTLTQNFRQRRMIGCPILIAFSSPSHRPFSVIKYNLIFCQLSNKHSSKNSLLLLSPRWNLRLRIGTPNRRGYLLHFKEVLRYLSTSDSRSLFSLASCPLYRFLMTLLTHLILEKLYPFLVRYL